MRIVYLHQYFTTPEMSGGTRSYELARRLVAAGHEVHVVTSQREPAEGLPAGRHWRQSCEAGIQVHWLPVPYNNRMSYPQRIRAFFEFAWQASRKARTLPADVIYATSTPLTIAIPGIRAARAQQVPFVFEVRDLWPETPIAVGALNSRLTIGLARRLEHWAYRNARHIVALSPGMRDGILETGIPADRVTVIPNACDFNLFDVSRDMGLEFRQRHAWLGDRPLLAYVGTLGRINGVGYMVRLAKACLHRFPEIRFLAVGTGVEEPEIRALAQRLDVWEKNFFLLPQVPKAEVPAILSAADLCSSWVINRAALWKNSANKLFDAMAAGRGIVINHGDWLADLCESRDLGVVLPAEGLDAAAELLAERLLDRDAVRRFGLNAARTGHELFDRDRLAQQLEHILQQAVDGSHVLGTDLSQQHISSEHQRAA